MSKPEGHGRIEVAPKIVVRSILGIPTVEPGDDLVEVIEAALARGSVVLRDHDILVLAGKIVSRAQDCFVDLSRIVPSDQAVALAEEVDRDPRLVELILSESDGVSRKREGALIVRHRLGFVSANAGIDASNAAPSTAARDSGPWVLTLPRDPDETAHRLRVRLEEASGAQLAVVLTDSWGRPFRRGTVGFALGSSGLPPIADRRGSVDRHGRTLEATETATADAVAAAADLIAGQANEGRPLTLIRGLQFEQSDESSRALLRDPETDLYA